MDLLKNLKRLRTPRPCPSCWNQRHSTRRRGMKQSAPHAGRSSCLLLLAAHNLWTDFSKLRLRSWWPNCHWNTCASGSRPRSSWRSCRPNATRHGACSLDPRIANSLAWLAQHCRPNLSLVSAKAMTWPMELAVAISACNRCPSLPPTVQLLCAMSL